MSRLTVPKTYKLYIGGKFPRTESGRSIAIENKKGETIKETQWHNLTVFGNLAEIAEQHLEKGKEVCIEGKLNNRTYDDKDGNKRYVTEIVVQELLMLGKKQ